MARARSRGAICSQSSARPTGYVRRLEFLSHLTLPEGAMDLGKNYPPQTVELVGPAVELVDLLISAAKEIHG